MNLAERTRLAQLRILAASEPPRRDRGEPRRPGVEPSAAAESQDPRRSDARASRPGAACPVAVPTEGTTRQREQDQTPQ